MKEFVISKMDAVIRKVIAMREKSAMKTIYV